MNPFLYLVTPNDDPFAKGYLEKIQLAIDGGVTLVQFRNKLLNDQDFTRAAQLILEVTKHNNIPLILNDRFHLVEKSGAQGAHIGQSDENFHHVRNILGKNAIIGLSIENLNDAQKSLDLDLNYIAASPIFKTNTKLDTATPLGLKGLKEIANIAKVPVVAIGGINLENAQQILNHGAKGLAIVSAIWNTDCQKTASKKFLSFMK